MPKTTLSHYSRKSTVERLSLGRGVAGSDLIKHGKDSGGSREACGFPLGTDHDETKRIHGDKDQLKSLC